MRETGCLAAVIPQRDPADHGSTLGPVQPKDNRVSHTSEYGLSESEAHVCVEHLEVDTGDRRVSAG